MGIDMGSTSMMASLARNGLRGGTMNETMMRYSRYADTYQRHADDPAMSAIRVGRSSRRTSRSGVRVRRTPARASRHHAGAHKGKFIVVGLLIVGFLCAAYFTNGSIDSMKPSLSGSGNAGAATLVSTPKSEWKRGSTPALYQTDAQWADTRYANDTLRESGCGPTCMSMVYVNLTGRKEMDPAKMCAYSENGGYVDSGATSWRFMSAGAEGLGLRSKELSADKSIIKNEVSAGHPVIAIMGPGDFTTTGHFIVICGIDENGRAIIRDPNSEENTKKAWSLDTIISQARNFWSYSI